MARTRPTPEIAFSRREKVLFPRDGITKGELIDYYGEIADVMLPHVSGRPTTLQRFPDGIHEFMFYQKEAPEHFPDWIELVEVEKKPTGKDPKDWQCQVICDRAETLMYLANIACITPHTWLSRKPKLNRPDRFVLDLDPSDDDFEKVREGAFMLKELLESFDLPVFVMTTGSRGLHVTVPIKPELEFDTVKPLTRRLSEELVARNPDCFTVEHRKAKRGERVFVDYLRNEYAQTAVPPYAVRARDGAPIATPLRWEELKDSRLHSQSFQIRNIGERIARYGDAWANMQQYAVSLKKLAKLFEIGG